VDEQKEGGENQERTDNGGHEGDTGANVVRRRAHKCGARSQPPAESAATARKSERVATVFIFLRI
jgi:hypothetical protein